MFYLVILISKLVADSEFRNERVKKQLFFGGFFLEGVEKGQRTHPKLAGKFSPISPFS